MQNIGGVYIGHFIGDNWEEQKFYTDYYEFDDYIKAYEMQDEYKQGVINSIFRSTAIKLDQNDHVSFIVEISDLINNTYMFKNSISFSPSNILKKDFGVMTDIFFGYVHEEKYKEWVIIEKGNNGLFIGNLPSHITEIEDPVITNLISDDMFGKTYVLLGLWMYDTDNYKNYNNTSIKNVKINYTLQEAFQIVLGDENAANCFFGSYFPRGLDASISFGVDYSGTFEFTDQTLTAEELKTIIQEPLNNN